MTVTHAQPRDSARPPGGGLTFAPPPRATLGAIQLPTDLTLDAEGPALVARMPDVRLRLNKLELDGEALTPETYATGHDRLRRAAATLRPADSFDALGLACTSLAFTLGPDHVQAELKAAHPHAAVTDMATAVVAALEHVSARKLALLTPYPDALHGRNLAFLTEAGYEVVADRNLGLATDAEITALSEDCLRRLIHEADDPEADAFLLGCSAFRALAPGFIDELEDTLHKPVLTSQQAFLWHLLRLANVHDAVGGFGRLLSGKTTAPPAAGSRPVVAVPATDDPTVDLYPSRVASPGLIPRVDPVIDPERRFAGPLSGARLETFARRGVIVLPQVFTPREVARLKGACDELRAYYEGLSYGELDRNTDMRVVTERGGALAGTTADQPILKSLWQIHLPPEHAPHMRGAGELSRRTICDARLVEAARQVLGEEVYVHQSRINFQPGWGRNSGGGSGFLWHQDFEQWHCEDGMPRMRAVSMAVLLEPAVPANGALMVMPGSHRRLLQAYAEEAGEAGYLEGALSSGPQLPDTLLHDLADRHGIEHCRGEAGDVVLFDCTTVHGSHSNISPWGRCMFFAVYNAVTNLPRERPYARTHPRPEHLGSRDPRWAGVPLPALQQDLAGPHP